MTDKAKPVLAITMGDPAGIGPEIVLRALAGKDVAAACLPIVVGDFAMLERMRPRYCPGVRLVRSESLLPSHSAEVVPVLQPWDLMASLPLGKPSAAAGAASIAYIERAVELAMDGAADGLVTAPISKEAIHLAGSPYPGHTEMLAALTDCREYAMMLVGGPLRVSLATIHQSLASVPGTLSADGIATVIRLTHRAVKQMGFSQPRIAVCGLNPHAGEGGLFGNEERTVIAPAIDRCCGEGIGVGGPYPADTVFRRAVKGDFDAVVAMYHDQGLAPLKTFYFDEGVNVTLGLPIIRTSVDHGTAYDIAGRGVADAASLNAAVRLAAVMAKNR